MNNAAQRSPSSREPNSFFTNRTIRILSLLKRMQYIVHLLILVLLGMFFASGCARRPPSDTSNSQSTSPVIQNTSPTPTPRSRLPDDADPRWIEALRLRTYQSQAKVEDQLITTPQFTSHRISYNSDGLNLFALMLVPSSGGTDTKYPVVIVNHGYIEPTAYSLVDSYRTITDYYASQGFLVLKPDYRGHGQSQSGGGEPFDRLDYAVDVLNLIAAIPSLPQADSSRLVMYGHSMGGDVTLKVLEVTDKVKAASLWAPVSISYPESLLYFIRLLRPEKLKEVETAISQTYTTVDFPQLSPITNTHFISAPLLVHHGTADESVPYEWSTSMVQVLTQTNVSHTLHTYPNEDHNFTKGSWETAASRDIQFFKQHL